MAKEGLDGGEEDGLGKCTEVGRDEVVNRSVDVAEDVSNLLAV